MFAPLLAVVVLQAAQAESSLAAGNIRQALRLAEQLVARQPRNAAAHFLLGRVHYARPIIGRFPALDEFRVAARLAPRDPAPWYWQMKVGFYLRSDDGDWIAREALLGLFAVTPDYQDAWQRFRDVYRSPEIWRRAERALARHGEQPVALEHRAELLIALERGAQADSLLVLATSRGAVTAATCLLRAEANFLAGRADAGFAWHDSAVARADADSTDALWDEARLIASPDEVARHEATPVEERRAFFARFWEQRDPDLLTPRNERLEEHYARRAEARRMYRLLHPQRTRYHSPLARALMAFDTRREITDSVELLPGVMPGPSWEHMLVGRQAAAISMQALQDTAMPLAFRAGLTAPGLVFLRHGRPDMQANCVSDLRGQGMYRLGCTSHLDDEAWLYWTPQGPLSVHFGRNEYFAPTSRQQVRSSYVLLNTDRSTLPAPLVAHAWTAIFMSAELGLTDIYYKARGDSAAVVLWGDPRVAPLRIRGSGLLQLTVPPGRYDLGLDIDSAGALGRIRRPLTVPAFSLADLGLSSLVLAPVAGKAVPSDRDATLRAMPADLKYPAGTPLAAYVEIYGLTADPSGRSRYRVRYSFAPVRSVVARMFGGSARPVVFEFERAATFSTASERLVIEPDKLPAGRYRVTVAVTDLSRNVKSESVALEIEIR